MERALVWGPRGARNQTLVGSTQNLCMCRQVCIYAQRTLGHTQAEIDTDAHRPMPTFTLDTRMHIHPACTRSCHTQTCDHLSKVGGRGSWRSLVCRGRRVRRAGGVDWECLPLRPDPPWDGEDEEGRAGTLTLSGVRNGFCSQS